MFHLRLTHGKSHYNGFVRVTQAQPDVYIEDEAVAKQCIDSGFFALVEAEHAPENCNNADGGQDTADKENGSQPDFNADMNSNGEPGGNPEDDLAELNSMTVPELKAYAENTGIDLKGATKKSDIIAAIMAAESAE